MSSEPQASVRIAPTHTAIDEGGVAYALLAYGSWGLAPLFWKQLHELGGAEVLAQRTVYGAITFLLLLAWRRRLPLLLAALRTPGMPLRLVGSALLLATNSFVFLYAVMNAHIVETSLGYFINPILNVALGTFVLRERLSNAQRYAVLLACAGVLLLALGVHGVPWIALSLAASFGSYGLLRKTLVLDPLVGSTIEMLALLPIALGYLLWLGLHGSGVLVAQQSSLQWFWLIASGPYTALPLLWFSIAARRLPLSSLGFFQYLSPSLQLALALLLYGEPFTRTHVQAFGLIWLGLMLYTWDMRRRSRELRAVLSSQGVGDPP